MSLSLATDCQAARFDAVLGPGRGSSGHAEGRAGRGRPWTLYHVQARVDRPSGARLTESRPARYRSLKAAVRGGAALRKRFPFYETEVRSPSDGGVHWRLYYRKLPGR